MIWWGHLPMCVAVFIAQVMLFRELANVRYKGEKAKEVSDQDLPLGRMVRCPDFCKSLQITLQMLLSEVLFVLWTILVDC